MLITIFGFPLYTGMSKRTAKHLSGHSWNKLKAFHNFKVGDLIRTCSGLNEFVLSAEPDFGYTKNGKVLLDISLSTTYNSCSLIHCCGLPISYNQAVIYRDNVVKEWGKTADEFGFAERYSEKVMKINADGTFSKLDDAKASMDNAPALSDDVEKVIIQNGLGI